MLKSIIKARYNNLLELDRTTSRVKHSGEKGGYREFFISQLIRPIIPSHFGIGNGIIIDSKGRQSPQIDILIYDKRLIPPIFESESRGIFPIDSVIAVLEIKSKLSTSDIPQLEKISECFIPKDGYDFLYIITPGKIIENNKPRTIYPHFAVFAFDSTAEHKDEANRLKNKMKKDLWTGVGIVCIANKGLWVFDRKKKDYNLIETDKNEIIVKFLNSVLDQLENIAQTRGNYQLSNWLR